MFYVLHYTYYVLVHECLLFVLEKAKEKTFGIDGHMKVDIACDSYHKYKDDVQLLKDIGVSIFNFAIYLICVVSFS